MKVERREKLGSELGGDSSQVSAHLLGLGQDADDFCVEVCYSVHVASVGTVIPSAHKVGFALHG